MLKLPEKLSNMYVIKDLESIITFANSWWIPASLDPVLTKSLISHAGNNPPEFICDLSQVKYSQWKMEEAIVFISSTNYVVRFFLPR